MLIVYFIRVTVTYLVNKTKQKMGFNIAKLLDSDEMDRA